MRLGEGYISSRRRLIRFRWGGFHGWMCLHRAREGEIAFIRRVWPAATATVFLVVVLRRGSMTRELVFGSSIGPVVERYSCSLREIDCGGVLCDNGRTRERPSISLYNNYDSLGIDWESVLRLLC